MFNGFAFDVEILYLADRLGLSVRPLLVTWNDVLGSSVHPGHVAWSMLRDIRALSTTRYENPVVELARSSRSRTSNLWLETLNWWDRCSRAANTTRYWSWHVTPRWGDSPSPGLSRGRFARHNSTNWVSAATKPLVVLGQQPVGHELGCSIAPLF